MLLRVEVYRAGQMLEGRTFPNPIVAHVYADHQRARGNFVIVMYPRAEPCHLTVESGDSQLVGVTADDQP